MFSLAIALGVRNDNPAVIVLGWIADAVTQVLLLVALMNGGA